MHVAGKFENTWFGKSVATTLVLRAFQKLSAASLLLTFQFETGRTAAVLTLSARNSNHKLSFFLSPSSLPVFPNVWWASGVPWRSS
jgi:hypothetical protein